MNSGNILITNCAHCLCQEVSHHPNLRLWKKSDHVLWQLWKFCFVHCALWFCCKASRNRIWIWSLPVKLEAQHDPAVPLLGRHPTESRSDDNKCSIHCSHENQPMRISPGAHQWMNGIRKCGICSQWSIWSTLKRRKFYPIFFRKIGEAGNCVKQSKADWER